MSRGPPFSDSNVTLRIDLIGRIIQSVCLYQSACFISRNSRQQKLTRFLAYKRIGILSWRRFHGCNVSKRMIEGI